MAKLAIKKATTDVTVYLFIQASNVTTGAGLTGLTFETASLVASYVRPLAARAALTLATLAAADSAHSDGGFIEVDATNMPGVYRLDLPDAVCATGVNSAVVMLKGAANMAPCLLEIQLASVDVNDAVRAGISALPNAAADAAGGLPISDAGALDLDTQIKTDIDALITGVAVTSIGNDVLTAAAVKADAVTKIQNGLATPTNITAGTIATVTNLTNLPATPANWLTGTGVDATAVTKLQAGLALEATLTAIKGAGWTTETLAAIDVLIDGIKAKSDQLVFTTPNKVDASATIDPTGLATSAALATVDGIVDDIKAKTDQLVFTTPNRVDASATVDPTGIATSAELEAVDDKVDAIKAKTDLIDYSSITVVPAVVGSTITILRGDTLRASLLNLGSLAQYVCLDFTVKLHSYDTDDDALIRVRKNASGLTDGLVRLNGAAHTTGTDGSITIDDAPTGDVTIMLKANITDDLAPGTYVYDIQLIEASEVTTLTSGTLLVTPDVTRLVA